MELTAEELEARFNVTHEEIDAWEQDAAQGILHGEPAGTVVRGRPTLFGEPMRSVTYKDDAALVDAMDKRAQSLGLTRSGYLRQLVRKDLVSADAL